MENVSWHLFHTILLQIKYKKRENILRYQIIRKHIMEYIEVQYMTDGNYNNSLIFFKDIR